ncbi:MAG: hypothetical protein ACR2NN_00895 [Bryobacteraceae bacterium]
MPTDALIWVLLPVFVAVGSALLSYSIMQARTEAAISKERESLAEARASIATHKVTMEERIRATEEETRRKALDEFMQEFRVEERHYIRENKSASMRRKTMVMQERLFFRNVPLSNWVEREMTIEESSGDPQIPETQSSLTMRTLADSEEEPAPAGLLN